jgi:hypothetical protein
VGLYRTVYIRISPHTAGLVSSLRGFLPACFGLCSSPDGQNWREELRESGYGVLYPNQMRDHCCTSTTLAFGFERLLGV